MNSGDLKRGLLWRGILISMQNVLHRLRLIHWSGPRVLALIVALFGTYGVISSVGEIARSAPPSRSARRSSIGTRTFSSAVSVGMS